jgi:hypothetical protein
MGRERAKAAAFPLWLIGLAGRDKAEPPSQPNSINTEGAHLILHRLPRALTLTRKQPMTWFQSMLIWAP